MLHYYPRHVSSINMPIFRRTNCIHTASGIVALCKRLHSTPVESKLVNEIILHYDARSKKHQTSLKIVLWEVMLFGPASTGLGMKMDATLPSGTSVPIDQSTFKTTRTPAIPLRELEFS